MRKRTGFALVEILIVIMVIGVLAGIAIPAVRGIRDQARISQAQGDLATLRSSVEAFQTTTDGYPDPAKGISLFLVDRESSGVSVRHLPGFLLGRSFEVKLDSVRVPRSTLLGQIDAGWPALTRAITRAIPVLGAYKAGACGAICELALEYSRIRVQFGMPIGRFQRVQDMIIDMVTHADSARWITYEALWKLDTDRLGIDGVHVAKAVASEAYWQTCTLAHQVFSGISYSKEHPVSFHTRASRTLYSFLGEPAYHRQQIARIVTSS